MFFRFIKLYFTLSFLLLGFTIAGCSPDKSVDTSIAEEDTATTECIPECDDRECGSDGCGGTCGTGCLGEGVCDETLGQCICEDIEPCGGDCPDGTICDEILDECVTCTPQCTDRECGSDGCGGTCGAGCVEGQRCDEDGLCAESAFGIGHWRFENIADGIVPDIGAHGLQGVLGGRAIQSSEVPLTAIPLHNFPNTNSIDFDWQDPQNGGWFSVMDVELQLSMGTNDFTAEAWVQLDQLSDTSDGNQRQVLLQKKREEDPDAKADYLVLVQRGALSPTINYGKTENFSGRELQIVFGTGDTIWSVTSNLEINDQDWHFISIAVDATNKEIRFGIDNTFETIAFEQNPRVINDGALWVGSHFSEQGVKNHFLRGSIDELRLSAEFISPEGLLNASLSDCNGNQTWDRLDVNNGNSPDCNQNRIPDECDVSSGESDDCQGDGIPDECQLEKIQELKHVQSEGSLAWRADLPYMAWMSRFDVVNGANILDSFEIHIGALEEGRDMYIYVWSDPDGDGHPRDAQVLWATSETMGSTRIIEVDVPDLDVGSTGASFFVGIVLPERVTETDFPAQFDTLGAPASQRSWAVESQTSIDADNISDNVDVLAPLEEILFEGNWVMYVQMYDKANDCDGNGLPDDCDIAADEQDDIDCNANADACDDCNGDGVLDSTELRDGLDVDNNGDGVPDGCQLVSNDCDNDGIPDDAQLQTAEDCNNNQILDRCDVANGNSSDTNANLIPDVCEDCNGNGNLDSDDITAGQSSDCDENGIPDECEVGTPVSPNIYSLDDGTQESQISFGGAQIKIAWLNQFTVQENEEWISAVQVAWGDTYPGLPAKVVVWSDPNGDGDPSDATVLQTANTKTTRVSETYWNTVSIPSTYVGPAGTSFFVGMYFEDIYATSAIAVDIDTQQNRSWLAFVGLSEDLDLNDLDAESETGVLFLYGALNFLVRAVSSDGVMSNDCNGDGVLDVCDPTSCE